MREFQAQTGGRYTYVDDVINLQDLALSFCSIFAGCENFIVSGCEVSGDTVSSGYVYINGKIRWFNGTTGVASWPQRIYELNSAETLTYANGQDKVGRHNYGCAIAAEGDVPSTDPITQSAPQYITLSQSGRALRMANAFFGASCLLLNPDDASQTVRGNVEFGGNVTIGGTLNLDSLTITSGNSVGRIFHDSSGGFVLQNRVGSEVLYAETISNEAGFSFSAEGRALLVVGRGSVTATVPFTAPRVNSANIAVAGNNVYEYSTNNDNGTLFLNKFGYDGGLLRYRDTVIGNGKGNPIVTIDGSESNVNFDATVQATSAVKAAFSLKSTFAHDNIEGFLKTLTITDKDDYVAAIFGYNAEPEQGISSVAGKFLFIINNLGAVNIAPAIYENGVALTSKYVMRSELPAWVFGNAPSSGMTQAQCDARYARLVNGFTQFIIQGVNTAQSLCNQIGALNQTAADSRYAKLNSYLADMAHTEAEKALIRQNIGAAAANQNTIYDSGWINVKGGLLFGRQWGKMVSLEGKLYARSLNETVFVIPAGIAPPAYDVELIAANDLGTSSDHTFRARIAAGTRNAIVTYISPGMYDVLLTITLTYMVA